MKLYKIHTMKWKKKKKIHAQKVTLKYLGKSKVLTFKNQTNKYNWLLRMSFMETNKLFG